MANKYDVKSGDLVYFKQRRKLALCKVVSVKSFDSDSRYEPGYREYILDIIETWSDHEFLEPIPVFLCGRRFKVGRTNPWSEYSGDWEFYDQQEIDKYYGLKSNPSNRRGVEIEVGCRRTAFGCAILVPLFLVFIILFAR